MAYDFLKEFMMFEDEDRFNRLCQAFENLLREFEDAEGKVSDAEIMQALDMVGFSLFRDSWEEFKKLDLDRNLSILDVNKTSGKKYLN
tara:strand:- start:399 stop:662 length:264 start_codon:yes stop_codon:yes gene_type:complete